MPDNIPNNLTSDKSKTYPLSYLFLTLGLAAVCIAIFFRVWRIGNIPGVNGDEALIGLAAQSILKHQAIPWRTTSGNPIDLFYLLPAVPLHAIFPPSAALLRVPAMISGILAVIFAAVYFPRIYGRWTGLSYTLLIAVLPENIIQSRFGWEPSQSVLFTEIVLFCSLMALVESEKSKKWFIGGGFALLAALMCHPTNIFISIFYFGAILTKYKDQISPHLSPKTSGVRALVYWAVILMVVFGILALGWSWVKQGVDTLLYTNSAQAFPIFFARLLNGITGFRYISAAWFSNNTSELAISLLTYSTLAVIVIAIASGIYSCLCKKTEQPNADTALFMGWVVVMFIFFIIAGAKALTPGNERYGLVLIAPTVLMVCRSIELMVTRSAIARNISSAALIAVAASFLVMFYNGYFWTIEHPYVVSELNFLTGPEESKAAALDLIKSEDSNPGHASFIIARSWHNVAPLKYLNNGDPNSNLHVLAHDEIESPAAMDVVLAASKLGQVWYVEYAISAELQQTEAELKAENMAYTEVTLYGYNHIPVEVVVHVTGDKAPG
jgi:hypothetical protein